MLGPIIERNVIKNRIDSRKAEMRCSSARDLCVLLLLFKPGGISNFRRAPNIIYCVRKQTVHFHSNKIETSIRYFYQNSICFIT